MVGGGLSITLDGVFALADVHRQAFKSFAGFKTHMIMLCCNTNFFFYLYHNDFSLYSVDCNLYIYLLHCNIVQVQCHRGNTLINRAS